MGAGELVIRSGSTGDIEQLTEIYNHYVLTTAITFDVETVTVEDRRRDWFATFADEGPYRLLVANQDGDVLGFACSSPFRPKAAYARSVATSIYCGPASVGRGIGTMLYSALLEAIRGQGLHRVLTGITLPNPGSVRLHERFGFTEIGVEQEVGWKFDRYWDVLLVERAID